LVIGPSSGVVSALASIAGENDLLPIGRPGPVAVAAAQLFGNRHGLVPCVEIENLEQLAARFVGNAE
jgi:hypothetical protein